MDRKRFGRLTRGGGGRGGGGGGRGGSEREDVEGSVGVDVRRGGIKLGGLESFGGAKIFSDLVKVALGCSD